ncbi:MAG: rhomboid family intramembrane serine protease [Polyangiales bacterium]
MLDTSSLPPADHIDPPITLVNTSRQPRRIDAWALALTAEGVSSVLNVGEDGLELHVAPHQVAFARRVADAVDAEERETHRAHAVDTTPLPVSKHGATGAVLVAFLLLAFFAVTGPRAGGSEWFTAGASDAERVLHGEWWRAITALSLHADGGHVLSNVGLGTLVVGAVMRSEGVGFGAALVLAAGTAGNLINAWAHQSLHSSVGFSTAVFAAIGLLGGIAYVQARRRIRRMRPAWTALAGTLALLALLGTSEKSNVDMLAHVFGAVAGVGLGVLTTSLRWRPGTAGQWLAGLGSAAAVLGAWVIALG